MNKFDATQKCLMIISLCTQLLIFLNYIFIYRTKKVKFIHLIFPALFLILVLSSVSLGLEVKDEENTGQEEDIDIDSKLNGHQRGMYIKIIVFTTILMVGHFTQFFSNKKNKVIHFTTCLFGLIILIFTIGLIDTHSKL